MKDITFVIKTLERPYCLNRLVKSIFKFYPDEEIKIHEHTPFFLKAKMNGLNVGFIKEMSVKHKPLRPKRYNSFRDRNFVVEWMRLYNIRRFIATVDDGEERVLTL